MVDSKVKKGWNVFTTVLVAVTVLLAVLLVGGRLLGLQIYTIESGSMEPAYRTGSVIYVKPVDTETLEEGDVISFQMEGGTVVTHRIVEVEGSKGAVVYRTKGDANDTEDGGFVLSEQVLGKVVFTIPYLGRLAAFIQTSHGRVAVIVYGVCLVLVLIVSACLPDEKKRNK